MKRVAIVAAALGALVLGGCLSARSTQRSYFVMHGEPREPLAEEPLIKGLVRVRSLDTDAVYEKFQIVVRRSPYQLRYSDVNVWAVKPNQMVADLVAAQLETSRLFSGVTRELIDARPDYTLAGQLHAIEVYDSDDLWFAHLEISLYLTRFADGERMWTLDFDQRKQITSGDFGHAARALSELFATVMTQAIAELTGLDVAKGAPTPPPPIELVPEAEPDDGRAPVLVPETNRPPREEDAP